MYYNKNTRTDMAAELRKRVDGEIPGVGCQEEEINGLSVFSVDIFNREGELRIGKAKGQYYTLSLPRWYERERESFTDAVNALSELIKRCLEGDAENILVAALGNPDITPDALGTMAANSVLVTRHLKNRKEFQNFCTVSLVRTGVLGTSGMESSEQIRILCEEIKPKAVLVIDALAGAEAEGLCHSVQVSNAGISPGSGVGNDRREISRETMGIPVISIGMPTVIDAGCIAEEKLSGMFVTPRDIDSMVRAGGRLIAYAINCALHKNLDPKDIEDIIGYIA